MTKKPNDRARFCVETVALDPRGDVYEIEYNTDFNVVDVSTREVVATFRGGTRAKLGDDGNWDNQVAWGTWKVEIADDASHALVYDEGVTSPRRIPLPGASHMEVTRKNGELRCPKCGSVDVSSALAPVGEFDEMRCHACGYEEFVDEYQRADWRACTPRR